MTRKWRIANGCPPLLCWEGCLNHSGTKKKDRAIPAAVLCLLHAR
jgi:hypothetical protein